MSKRQYDGTPIDLTWDNGPWANDGETVDATNNEDGNMKTIEWPDNATDPEKLNKDQIKVIRIAARNPDIDNYQRIQEMANVDKSESYAAWVLREHWPERHEAKGHNTPALSDREVDKVRIALNNGETVPWLSDHFDVTQETVRRAARGARGYNNTNCKTPPLIYEDGEWSIKNTNNGVASMKSKVSKPYPTATVDAWRKRALNGDTATDIADEYDKIWPAGIAMALRGDADIDGEPSQPELEWCNNDKGWIKKESDSEVENEQTDVCEDEDEEKVTNTEEAKDSTDTSIPGETPTYHPPERDTNTKRLAAGVAIIALVSYVLGKLRGGQ